jgi:hypothetical protein
LFGAKKEKVGFLFFLGVLFCSIRWLVGFGCCGGGLAAGFDLGGLWWRFQRACSLAGSFLVGRLSRRFA